MFTTKRLAATIAIVAVFLLGAQAQIMGLEVTSNGDVDVNGKLKKVGTPTVTDDAATKGYVDSSAAAAASAIVASGKTPNQSYYIRNDGWAEVIGWAYVQGISGTSTSTAVTINMPTIPSTSTPLIFLPSYMDVSVTPIGYKDGTTPPASRTDITGMGGGDFAKATIVNTTTMSSATLRVFTYAQYGYAGAPVAWILVSYRIAGWVK